VSSKPGRKPQTGIEAQNQMAGWIAAQPNLTLVELQPNITPYGVVLFMDQLTDVLTAISTLLGARLLGNLQPTRRGSRILQNRSTLPYGRSRKFPEENPRIHCCNGLSLG